MSIGLATTSQGNRVRWMDVARGVAILLVIGFHSVSEVDKQFGLSPLVTTINEIVSPARMPLMVFLSGMLLPKSLSKPIKEYITGKVSRIAWPFVLWSLIMLALITAGNPSTRSEILPRVAAALTYSPLDHLWFLRDLFIFYVLALLLRRVPWAVVASSALFVGVTATIIDAPDLLRGSYLLVFFMLGAGAGSSPKILERLLESRLALGLAFIVAAAIIPAALQPGDVRYQLIFLPIAAALAYLMLRLCQFISSFSAAEPLSAVGRDSLVYYLAHWPIIVVLANVIPGNLSVPPVVVFVAVLVVAFGGSYVLAKLSKDFALFRSLTSIPLLEKSRLRL